MPTCLAAAACTTPSTTASSPRLRLRRAEAERVASAVAGNVCLVRAHSPQPGIPEYAWLRRWQASCQTSTGTGHVPDGHRCYPKWRTVGSELSLRHLLEQQRDTRFQGAGDHMPDALSSQESSGQQASSAGVGHTGGAMPGTSGVIAGRLPATVIGFAGGVVGFGRFLPKLESTGRHWPIGPVALNQ